MKKQRALIVDNEKLMVELVSKAIEEQGFEIEKAYSGLEALEKLKRQKFDMVFLDLIMPRIGGDKICRFMRESQEHQSTKIIIVSGISLEDERDITSLGADICIAKAPFPEMKKNIIKAIKKIKNSDTEPQRGVIGRENLVPRSIVKELLFGQKHVEAILNCMTEGVLELNPDSIITYANPAAQIILGKKEMELIGEPFIYAAQFEDSVAISSVFRDLLMHKGKTTKQLPVNYLSRNLSFSFTKILQKERLIGFAVIINDLTEKVRLENEQKEKQRLKGAIEMAGAAAHEINQPLAVVSGHAQMLMIEAENAEKKILRRASLIFEQVQRLGDLTKKIANIISYKTKDYGKDIRIIDIEKASRENDALEEKQLLE